MDDVKSSHQDKEVNDIFLKWPERTYGEDEIGKVKEVRGLKHDYLAMILDFTANGRLRLNMVEYTKHIIEIFHMTWG